MSISQRQTADWDIRMGARNFTSLVVAQVVGSGAAFAGVWVAVRAMGPAGYGRVAAVVAATQLVMQVALNWSTFSLTRFGCEEFGHSGRIANSFWTRLSLLVANLLVVIVTSPLWLPRVASWLRLSPTDYPLVLSYTLATALWLHVQQALQAAKLHRIQSLLFAAERMLILAMLGLLSLTREVNVTAVITVYIAGAAAVCTVGLWIVRVLIRPLVLWDRTRLGPMLWFALPLIPGSVVGYVSGGYLDAVFITQYVSLAALGVYSVAFLVSGTIMQLPTLVSRLLLSLFVSLRRDGRDAAIESYFRDVCPLGVLLWSFACATAAVGCGYLLPLLFGKQYGAVSTLMWPLMAAVGAAGPVLLGYSAVSFAWSSTHINLIALTLQAAVNIALDRLLIPRFGLTGCAWASVGASFVSLVAWACFVQRRLRSMQLHSVVGTFPVLAGAVYASWRKDDPTALAISALTCMLIVIWRRRHHAAAIRALHDRNVFRVPKFVSGWCSSSTSRGSLPNRPNGDPIPIEPCPGTGIGGP